MEWTRTQGSLKAAQLCLEQQLSDSAVSRAYFAAFQAAICALETQGIKRDEWTHKGVHSDFVHRFVSRRKIVPASFASALPNLMRLRHIGDYRQPRVSQRANASKLKNRAITVSCQTTHKIDKVSKLLILLDFCN